MLKKYADIIIDISHEDVDRTFQYSIPDRLSGFITDRKYGSDTFWKRKSYQNRICVGRSDIPYWRRIK